MCARKGLVEVKHVDYEGAYIKLIVHQRIEHLKYKYDKEFDKDEDSMSWICPECQYENDGDLIRCVCGHEISEDQIAIQENISETDETPEQMHGITKMPWIYILHLVLSIGGGALGVAAILLAHVKNTDPNFLINITLSCLYAYGVFAGIRFLRDGTKKLLGFYYLIQVPIVSSPFFSYQLSSGFLLSGVIFDDRIHGSIHFGCKAHILVGPSLPWGAGINFFAVFMLYLLIKEIGFNGFSKTDANTFGNRIGIMETKLKKSI